MSAPRKNITDHLKIEASADGVDTTFTVYDAIREGVTVIIDTKIKSGPLTSKSEASFLLDIGDVARLHRVLGAVLDAEQARLDAMPTYTARYLDARGSDSENRMGVYEGDTLIETTDSAMHRIGNAAYFLLGKLGYTVVDTTGNGDDERIYHVRKGS
jgi:hypothetical protein